MTEAQQVDTAEPYDFPVNDRKFLMDTGL